MLTSFLIYNIFFIFRYTKSLSSIKFFDSEHSVTVKNENDINTSINNIDTDYFLKYEFKSTDENDLLNIYFFNGSHYNSSFEARYLNQKNPLIYINPNITKVNSKIYINCVPKCDFILYYQLVKTPYLKDNTNISFYYKENPSINTIYYKPEISDLNSNNILINVMGKSIENFPISFYYGDEEIKCQKNFINGKGLLITKKSGIILDNSKNFSIKYTPILNDSVTISTRIISIENEFSITEIDLLSEKHVVLTEDFSKECFSVKSDYEGVIYLNGFSKQGIKVQQVDSNDYNEVIKEKEIINSDYFLFDLSSSKIFCFTFANNMPQNTIDFQIVIQEQIMDNMHVLMPILRGVEYKFLLKNSTMVYHRLASFNKNVKSNQKSDFFVKLQLLRGKIDFYEGKCSNFPNCTIDKETFNASSGYTLTLISNAFENGIDFGDATFESSYSIIYFSLNQILPAVKCTNEEYCEYKIQIMNLINDLRYTPISYGKNIYKNYDYIGSNFSTSICYAFDVEDENITSIKIELNSLSGNSDLKSFSDSSLKNQIGDYFSLGNKEFIIINKSENEENLINQYYYCINNSTSAFSISKIILKSDNSDDYITEGETEINSINKKEKTKKFVVLKQTNFSYFIFVKALNCKLNISYDNNDNNSVLEKSAQFLDFNASNENVLTIIFDSLDSERTNENENCIFYTGVSDVTKPIIINEGISYDLTLSKNLKKMMFRYEFFLNKTKLLIFIDKYDPGTLKITVHSVNSKEYYLTDFNNFKAIDVNLTNITLGNNLKHSVVFIDIEYYEAIETDIKYSLEIFYTEDKLPYYLPPGELILDIMELGGTQYFYTDIKIGKYAEIVLNSKTHPFTNFYAKIIKKNETDDSSTWNNYVKLPINNSLTYDGYNRKFIIYENDTDDCDEDIGCELYIGFKNSQTRGLYLDYSIFLRYDDTIVKVPNDEYIFGSLEINDVEKQIDYYSYTVRKNINKFHIIFDTEFCELYINEGLQKPTNISYNYSIRIDEHSLIISDESSLINKVYTIAVIPKDLKGNYKTFYRFKIVEQPYEQIIYFIESQSEEFCEIKNDGGNCFYVLKYNSRNEIYNFYARNTVYMGTNIINIEAKIVNMKEFELSNDKLSYFNNGFEFNNSLNGYLNFKIDLDSYDEEQFILIKLTSEHEGKISFTSQFYPFDNTDYLNPNYYKIFTNENYNYAKSIRFEGNDLYSFRFQNLNISSFNLSQANTNFLIELSQENQNNIALIDKKNNGSSHKSDHFKVSSEIGYYTLIGKYTERASDKNFDTIEFGHPNYFTYYKKSESDNIFPIIFYIPVVQTKKDVIIYVNITNDISSIDDFNVYVHGLLTNLNSVMDVKKNLNKNFNIYSTSKSKYNSDEKYATFKFLAKESENFKSIENKYFYITLNDNNKVYNLPNLSLVVDIKLSEENENSSSHSNSESEHSSSSSDEDDSIIISNPENISTKSYYNSTLKKNEINSFLLNFFETTTSNLKIEISYPKNDYSISFRAYKNSSTKSPLIKDKNIKDSNSNGKTFYIISDLSNYSGVVIQLSPKNNRKYRKVDENNNSQFFMVKYNEYTNDEEIVYDQYYFNNNSISFSSNDDNYIWTVEQINSKNNNNNYSVKYSLNLFNSNDYSSISNLESIGFGKPIKSFDNYTLNDSSKIVEFNVNKKDISNQISNYYINVIANVTYNNNDYELLSAKPISFRINSINNEEDNSIVDEDKSNDDDDDNSYEEDDSNDDKKKNTTIIICIIFLFIIIVVVIIVFFYLSKKKYKNKTHEKFNNEGKNINNFHTEQNYINITEKPDIKNLEMKNVEHPVDIE